MSAELKTRIEAGDLHFLDGLVLLGTIASQRWFAGKSRDVLDARVLDAGIVPGGPPILAFAIVEVRYGPQSHDLYHLPLGFRPADEGWNQSVIAEPGGWTVYDAIVDPELMRQLVGLMRTNGDAAAASRRRSTSTARTTLPRAVRDPRRWASSSRTARSCSTTSSCSSSTGASSPA